MQYDTFIRVGYMRQLEIIDHYVLNLIQREIFIGNTAY